MLSQTFPSLLPDLPRAVLISLSSPARGPAPSKVSSPQFCTPFLARYLVTRRTVTDRIFRDRVRVTCRVGTDLKRAFPGRRESECEILRWRRHDPSRRAAWSMWVEPADRKWCRLERSRRGAWRRPEAQGAAEEIHCCKSFRLWR